MRRTLIATLAAVALVGVCTPRADAYTRDAAPVLLNFNCNADGTLIYEWDKSAGKPLELVIRQVFPTPERSALMGIPGSRGSKGFYVFASDYATSGNQLEGRVRTRSGLLSNAVSSTCP